MNISCIVSHYSLEINTKLFSTRKIRDIIIILPDSQDNCWSVVEDNL